jgi:formate dehydrogenase major subunit
VQGTHITEAKRDLTLQHPRCVFQVLKRHYAR